MAICFTLAMGVFLGEMLSQPGKVFVSEALIICSGPASHLGGVAILQVASCLKGFIYDKFISFRFTELDGQRIDHLDYHEVYNPQSTSQSSAEEMEEQKKHSARQDEFILKHLFKETGKNIVVVVFGHTVPLLVEIPLPRFD